MNTLFIKLKNFVETKQKASVAFILLLAFFSYVNIFFNQFVMDDYDFIVQWPLITDWKNALRFFIFYIPPDGQIGIYSPLKTVFHALTYHLFGENPIGYHGIALLIHFTAVIFIYRISCFLTKNRWVAFLTSLFFAVHPVNTEAITYMTASIDMVGIVFLFISFDYYLRSGKDASCKNSRYLLSLMFAFLAIFTHELAIAIPVLFLFYDYCFYNDQLEFKQIIVRTWPYFAIVLFYALIKFFILGTITRGGYLYDNFYLTMLVSIKALAQYVLIVFFPLTLTVNHVISKGIFSYDVADFDKIAVFSQNIFDIQILISIGLIGLIIFLMVKVFKKNKLILFCLGWFFISLLPVANIVPSGVYFAERYLYPGLFAFCMLLAIALNFFNEQKKVLSSAVCLGLIVVVTLFYSVRTAWRNFDWHDEVMFYESAVRANPESAFLFRDLGITYLRYGQVYKALYNFQKAVQLKPDNAEIHFSLAEGYKEINEFQRASDALLKAVEIDEDFAEAHYNLAGLYAHFGNERDAELSLNKSLEKYQKQGKILEAYHGREAFLKFFKESK